VFPNRAFMAHLMKDALYLSTGSTDKSNPGTGPYCGLYFKEIYHCVLSPSVRGRKCTRD